MRIFTLLPILLLWTLAWGLQAQQTPYLSHYGWNPRLFNPAAQGSGNTGELALIYRNQFSQLDASVRPNTYLVHADISSFLNDRIGLAVQLLGDKSHLLNRFQIGGFFSYHLIQNDRLRLSLGAFLGYINQNFDFNGVRVSDLQDISLFDNRVNAGRLDGGPGLAFEYRLPGGSFFALDAAASQLFSSDIRIRESGATTGAVYDLVPHVLANGRFRFQLAGLSLEPNVIFRAIGGDRSLPAGVFDFNLNTYFLKDNRLMVGGGIRTGTGGFHLQVGVAPARNTRINLSGELHPSLGATFEVGASYTFDRNREKPNLVQGPYQKAKEIANGFNFRVSSIKTEQDAIGNAITGSAGMTNLRQRTTASDQCAALLAQTERSIQEVRSTIGLLEAQYREAEKIVRNAEVEARDISEDTRNDLTAIAALQTAAENELNALLARQLDLSQKCTALRPEINELNCIRSGDAACIEELFAARLQQQSGNPAELFPLQINASAGSVSLGYRFPNDEEAYTLPPAVRNLATNLATQVNELAQQGIRLEAIQLITELQEDESTLQYNPGTTYAGDLENELPVYALIDNKTGARSERQVSADVFTQLSLEQIGALKLASLKSYLVKMGIPADKISLTLRYNHPENTYREETRIVLRLRT